MPRGSRRVSSDEIAEMQTNRFGALMAEAPSRALRYRVTAGRPRSTEPAPIASDLEVPEVYADVLNRVLDEIGIEGLDAPRASERIQNFFLKNFSYSLVQTASRNYRTPLTDFLLTKRRGHCEYFATAMVLLLRQAGIPARYAVGYVVEDYSALERAYIARARHAHSWALAHVNREWITVDSTPGVWCALENEEASNWQSFQDVLYWGLFRYQRFSQADWNESASVFLWLVPPLAIVLYIRLRRSPTAVRRSAATKQTTTEDESDTPLSALLDDLKKQGLHPNEGETLARFLRRAAPPEREGISLNELLRSYYQLRFSPETGVNVDAAHLKERADLYARASQTGQGSRQAS